MLLRRPADHPQSGGDDVAPNGRPGHLDGHRQESGRGLVVAVQRAGQSGVGQLVFGRGQVGGGYERSELPGRPRADHRHRDGAEQVLVVARETEGAA